MTGSQSELPPLSDVLAASGMMNLGQLPPPESVEAALRELVHLIGRDPLRRELAAQQAVASLKEAGVSRASFIVNAAFGGGSIAKSEEQRPDGAGMPGDSPPWPNEVEGEKLLDEMAEAFRKYLVLSDEAITSAVLWTIHAHAHDAAYVSPLLAITSPEKRCGKTTLLTLLSYLVPRPLQVSNLTPAVVFRAIDQWRPTLLIDEADTYLTKHANPELRGTINSGHTRAGAWVPRVGEVNGKYQVEKYSTWAPKAVALIDESGRRLHTTLADRSIELKLRRKVPGDRVARVRLDALEAELEPVRSRAVRWAQDHIAELRSADPFIPPDLNDRAADNWRPLLSIADAVGGVWPGLALRAAQHLGGVDQDDESAGALVLSDIQTLFRSRGTDRLTSADIVTELVRMEGRPWLEWSHGRGITPTGVARLLKPYGISPSQHRFGAKTMKGYLRSDFADAFRRYLPEAKQGKQSTSDLEERQADGRNEDVDVSEPLPWELQLPIRRVSAVSPDDAEREVWEI